MSTLPPHDQNDNPLLKYCPHCLEDDCWHPATLEYFHRNNRSKDKLNRLCKKCNTAHATRYKQEKRKNRPRKPVPMHCKHGHPLTEENIRIHNGRRECKVCHRIQARKNGSTDPGYLDPKRRGEYCSHGHPLVEGNIRKGKNAGACLTCHRESAKLRYHKNPEKMVAQASAYAKVHRPQINEWFKGYRQQESWKERERASRKRHREQRRLKARKRYWGNRLNDHEMGVEYTEMLYGDPCCYCGAPMKHIDHIVPVTKNGPEHWTNLTAACERCNHRKNNKSLLEFLLYRQEHPDRKEEAQ